MTEDEDTPAITEVDPANGRMSDYRVRVPEHGEIKYLVSMARRLHDNSAFRNMDFDEDQVERLGHMSLENKTMFLRIIEHAPTNVPVGLLLAVLQPSFFGRDLVANDMTLLVEEEHRGKCFDAIKYLTAMYRDWAQTLGAKRVYLGTSTGIDPERARKTFEACGFHQIGTLHEA
jgi:GNAT superfamily N-acetyltransferase